MKKLITIAGVAMLLTISALALTTAEATNNSLEDRVAYLEEELAFQTGNIEELELLQWRHQDRVITVVTSKLWERASTCTVEECYFGDPVLYAFYQIPAHNRYYYIQDLLVNGSWSAERVSEAIWLVTATDQEGYHYTFVADSMYHLICWEQSYGCQQ
jgi:hypothetical protein